MSRETLFTGTRYLWCDSTPVTTAPLTLATWFNAASITPDVQIIFSVGSSSNSHAYRLYLVGSSLGTKVGARIKDAAGSGLAAYTASSYGANQWHHGCAVFQSNTVRSAYLDGAAKGTASAANSPADLNLVSIGTSRYGTSTEYTFSGYLAEAAIWNVALTDNEVAILGRGYSPLLVRPQSLVAYWPLIGNESPETDLRGGYNLTVTGATKADHPRIILPAQRRLVSVPTAVPTTRVPIYHLLVG